MITLKARLRPEGARRGGAQPRFCVMELTNLEGDDMTGLVRGAGVFRTMEELNAFLTLRLAREAEVADWRQGPRLRLDT